MELYLILELVAFGFALEICEEHNKDENIFYKIWFIIHTCVTWPLIIDGFIARILDDYYKDKGE